LERAVGHWRWTGRVTGHAGASEDRGTQKQHSDEDDSDAAKHDPATVRKADRLRGFALAEHAFEMAGLLMRRPAAASCPNDRLKLRLPVIFDVGDDPSMGEG